MDFGCPTQNLARYLHSILTSSATEKRFYTHFDTLCSQYPMDFGRFTQKLTRNPRSITFSGAERRLCTHFEMLFFAVPYGFLVLYTEHDTRFTA